MIRANELRIGNFVSVNKGFEMLVHSIYKDDTLYLDFIPPLVNEGDIWEEDVSDVSPIKLTEEWLEKFGFLKLKGVKRKFYSQMTHIKDDFFVGTRDKRACDYKKGKSLVYVCHGDNIIDLYYVHQLQNLFFSLTGKELTFKKD